MSAQALENGLLYAKGANVTFIRASIFYYLAVMLT